MFNCPFCRETFYFLRDKPNQTPTTTCNKCRHRFIASLGDNPDEVAVAEAMVSCKVCNIAYPPGDMDGSPCATCRTELQRAPGVMPVYKLELDPLAAKFPSDSQAPASLAYPMALMSSPISPISNQIFRTGLMHQSQASLAGGHLAQSVNYVPPFPLPPNLAAAHQMKSLTKRNPGHLMPSPTLYGSLRVPQFHSPPRDSAGKYQIYRFIGVYALPARAGAVAKLVLLDDLDDGFGAYQGTTDATTTLAIVAHDIKMQYNPRYKDAYGDFPAFSKMSFQLHTGTPASARSTRTRPLPLKPHWLNGSIGKLVNELREANQPPSNGKLIIRMTWRQESEESSEKGDDDDNDNDKDSIEGGRSGDAGGDAGGNDNEEGKDDPSNGNSSGHAADGYKAKSGISEVQDENEIGLDVDTNEAINSGDTSENPQPHTDSNTSSGDVLGDGDQPEPKDGTVSHEGLGNRNESDQSYLMMRSWISVSPHIHQQPLPEFNPTVPDGYPSITYTPHQMKYMATCIMSSGGTLATHKFYCRGKEKMIADNWVHDIVENRGGKQDCSLLGKGAYKVAIRAMLGNDEYAILTSLPPKDELGETLTEEDNFRDLVMEHHALVRGQYFMEKWSEDLQKVGYGVLKFRFNAEGAFFGKLDAAANPECGTGKLLFDQDGPGKGALPFVYFLAVRLLCIDDQHVEERYTPSSGLGGAVRSYRELMNSFIHYTFQSSHRSYLFDDLQGIAQPGGGCILIDPQYHLANAAAKPDVIRASWDFGDQAIDRFIEEHSCGKTCDALKLRKPGTLTPKRKPKPRKRVLLHVTEA